MAVKPRLSRLMYLYCVLNIYKTFNYFIFKGVSSVSELICKCKKAKEAAQGMVKINTKTKNDALDCIAKA